MILDFYIKIQDFIIIIDVLVFSKNNDSTATIPSSICIISSDASIKTLKKIEIIESYAFSGTSIKQISIPKTVKKIIKENFLIVAD